MLCGGLDSIEVHERRFRLSAGKIRETASPSPSPRPLRSGVTKWRPRPHRLCWDRFGSAAKAKETRTSQIVNLSAKATRVASHVHHLHQSMTTTPTAPSSDAAPAQPATAVTPSSVLYKCEPKDWLFLPKVARKAVAWLTITGFSLTFFSPALFFVLLVPSLWKRYPWVQGSIATSLALSYLLPLREW